jgi:hypothetical protein
MDKPVMFETRTVTADFEMRDDSTTGAPTLEGYAATFNQEYDLGPFRERIDPGAFARTLSNGPDVRLLIDHEGQPLARTKSGTLQLSTDSQGLHARATLDPADPDVQRLLPKMRRGDLDQMSFAFRVPSGGDAWENDYTLRTIREANLAGGDVSVVTYPANENTTVSVRAENLKEARCLWAIRVIDEYRAGATISAATATKLRSILGMIGTADDNVDQAQADLADLLGVPNPDSDDPVSPGDSVQQNSGNRLLIARATLLSLKSSAA